LDGFPRKLLIVPGSIL